MPSSGTHITPRPAHIRDPGLLRTSAGSLCGDDRQTLYAGQGDTDPIGDGSAPARIYQLRKPCEDFRSARLNLVLQRDKGDVPLRPGEDVVILPFQLEKHVLHRNDGAVGCGGFHLFPKRWKHVRSVVADPAVEQIAGVQAIRQRLLRAGSSRRTTEEIALDLRQVLDAYR